MPDPHVWTGMPKTKRRGGGGRGKKRPTDRMHPYEAYNLAGPRRCAQRNGPARAQRYTKSARARCGCCSAKKVLGSLSRVTLRQYASSAVYLAFLTSANRPRAYSRARGPKHPGAIFFFPSAPLPGCAHIFDTRPCVYAIDALCARGPTHARAVLSG